MVKMIDAIKKKHSNLNFYFGSSFGWIILIKTLIIRKFKPRQIHVLIHFIVIKFLSFPQNVARKTRHQGASGMLVKSHLAL